MLLSWYCTLIPFKEVEIDVEGLVCKGKDGEEDQMMKRELFLP
jgi:hypothetical protein